MNQRHAKTLNMADEEQKCTSEQLTITLSRWSKEYLLMPCSNWHELAFSTAILVIDEALHNWEPETV